MEMEEIIKRANSGNEDAILLLGHYYFDNDHPERRDIDESIKWYTKGAELGYTKCMHLVALLLSMNGHVIRKIAGTHEVDEQIEYYNTGLYWLDKAISIDGNNEKYSSTYNNLVGEKGISTFLKGLSTKDLSLYVEAINLLKSVFINTKDPSVLMYLGYAIHSLHLENGNDYISDEDQELHVYVLHKFLESNSENETEISIAYYCLGYAYSLGLGTEVNYDMAVEYYTKATERGFDCSDMLKFFKKKMFGGWKFIG